MPLPIQMTYSDVADQNAYETYAQTTLGDTLKATWDETTEYNPTVAAGNLFSNDDPNTPMLSASEAQTKYGIGDLRFDNPVLESTAKRLYDSKYGEIKRQEIMRKGPSGIGPGIAKFGTAIAASAIDPLNIAAAFIPSFAIGKAAEALKMAEPAFIAGRGGTIGERALGGAVEGALGTAIIEPLPYLSAKKNQLDYDMGDSLLNIAIGGVLGGGLHAVARGLEIRGEKINEARQTELSKMIDSLPPESRQRLLASAFAEISQGNFPTNASNLLAREIIANQPHGLTDFTFRVDGSLSMENQQRLMNRAGSEAAASIPVERFDSRSKADAFIRSQDDRAKFLTQSDGQGGYVVTEIKPASMVRDGLGVVQRYGSYEDAAAAAKEIGNAQPVGFVKEKGKSGQEFVVVKGITPEDAARLQKDASYAEFYDPFQGRKTKEDTNIALNDNGIRPEEIRTNKDMSNDLFVEPQQIPEIDYGKIDNTVESARAEADTAIQMLKDIYPEAEQEYSAIFEGIEKDLADAKIEAQGWKYLGACMLRNQ